jgi:tetratricopeptide (TPR) repeat protein
LQGKVTLFCNIGEFGGSRAFARAEKASLWFTEKDGSAAIPPNSDGLIVAEVDLEKQFEVRRSIAEHTAVKDLRVYPVLYTFESEEAQEYVAVVESIMSEGSANALDNMRERIGPFTSLTPQVFPKLLQDKLQHFSSQIVEAGVITVNEASLWLEAIVVGETPPTHLLRWEMCNDSIRVLQEALISGRLLAKAPELVDVHKELINRRNKLTAYVRPPERSADRARPGEPSGPSVIQESAFFDRERVFDRIRVFMSQHQEAAFILAGMRGIGKTSLIQAAFRQAIPPRKSIWIQLTEGTSYERLLVVLAHNCHLRVPENLDLSSEADQQDLEHRITSYLSQTPGTVVVLDEFQYLLAGGEIEDAKIRALLVELLEKHGKNKFIFISHVAPKLGPDLQALCSDYRLQGLTDPDTIRLLQHWYQFGRDEASTGLPTPSERLLAILGGHPLATKVAARLCTERPISEVLEGISIFRELRDTMVAFILEEITLSPQEQDLLAFASVFRLPVSRDAFVQRKGEDANAVLNSLTGQFLIEASEGGYQLHPLVRDYFYEKVVSEKAIEFHKRAARYYLEAFEKEKASTKTVVPEFLGEAIHHFLAAGEKHKVQGMALYKQELGPVAKAHYRRGDLKLALKDYRVLVELNDRDADAHLHLALIYARANRWDDAEKHFGKAITVRPKAYWILQAYGNAKLRAGKIAEAEDLLTQAEEANPHHSPTLVDLGRIYQRKGDIETAKNYYKGAIELDPNHSYAYYQLARLLYDEGDMKEAYEMAKMAMSTKPTDERNRKLVRELKEIVEQLQQNSKETGSG